MKPAEQTRSFLFILFLLLTLSVFSGVFAADKVTLSAAGDDLAAGTVVQMGSADPDKTKQDEQPLSVVSGGSGQDDQTVTIDFSGSGQDEQPLSVVSGGSGQDDQTVTIDFKGKGQDEQQLSVESGGSGANIRTITIEFSGAEKENQTITVDYADEWLLQPDDVYNHKLMQASFALAAAGFRDKRMDLSQKDHHILDFFAKTGYNDPRTIDFNVIPSIDTIGTAIAHKKIGDAVVIAVSISGNNYQGEWAGNLTIDDDNRVKGFNDAADKVMTRLINYIRDYDLKGNLRLWTAGYSRSAAVTNDFAADAVDSGFFQAVYAYTFATPRTTRDEDADQYHTIFNMINPFDMVPMSPFPEWGFVRYGTDLFFPAVETDSRWYTLQQDVYEKYFAEHGEKIVLNPQISKNLHTVFDYLAFFISSAESYKTNVQTPLVEYIQTRDMQSLLHEMSQMISSDKISEYLLRRDEIARYQMHEFYNFLDFLTQFIYTSLVGQHNIDAANIYWDPGLSVQENLAFNHYDKTYRAWLFSNDDPEAILSNEANYAHVVIQGDVDVDVFDEDLNFIVHVNNEFDSYSYSIEDVSMPDYAGVDSDTFVYFERQKGQTLIILPLDQIFHVGIYSHKDQQIRVSYVEFSSEKLQADLRYIYLDDYDEGEYYLETFDPEKEREYTTEELQDMGVIVIEPWSNRAVYSPTAIMRLENEGVSHPSAKILLIVIGLLFILLIILVVLAIILICKLIRKILKKTAFRSAPQTD